MPVNYYHSWLPGELLVCHFENLSVSTWCSCLDFFQLRSEWDKFIDVGSMEMFGREEKTFLHGLSCFICA